MSIEPGSELLHYRIVEKIGEGGMGVVWKALDTTLDREVALKVLPIDVANDPDRLTRFEREAKALAALDHPNIVTIHTVQQAEGLRFITMELVRGTPLAERIPEAGLAPDELLRIGVTLADALAAAHEKGLVHRDLKPANVMVGGDGRVRVLDFGLAKLSRQDPETDQATQAVTATVTGVGMVVGTLPYMSPEQLKGEAIDHRTDIFSLGVMLYEMASGRHPFPANSNAELVAAILTATPPPPNEVRSELPEGLGRVIARCMQKDPAGRYASAVDLRDALRDPERQPGASPVATSAAAPEPRREETGSKSSKESLDLDRRKAREKAQGFLLRGVITAASGVAMMPFLYFLIPESPIWPVGAVALLVGIVWFGWGRYLLKQQPGED